MCFKILIKVHDNTAEMTLPDGLPPDGTYTVIGHYESVYRSLSVMHQERGGLITMSAGGNYYDIPYTLPILETENPRAAPANVDAAADPV